MKFQPGDKVIIKHSNEEGEVIDIINDTMVMVEIKGVKFPAYIDQLDFPYFKQFSEKKLVPEKKDKKYVDQLPAEKTVIRSETQPGVWLTLIPTFTEDEFGDELVQLLKVYLINGTTVDYQFHCTLRYLNDTFFDLKNKLYQHQDFYLTDIPFENINDSPSFGFEFSLMIPDKRKADYHETMLKLKPKQVFTKIEQIKKEGLSSFSYQLFESYPDKVYEEKLDLGKLSANGFKVYEASKFREYIAPARDTIDLHIEKITDGWEKLNNFDILTLQLAEFEKYYELAVLHHQAYLTVIHGIGSGRLKEEIHTLLKDRKEVKSFENKYHPSHGYGATIISFSY